MQRVSSLPRARDKNDRLPKYVYLQSGRYLYRPYLGSVKGKAKFGKAIRLCSGNASLPDVWRAYSAQVEQNDSGTLKWLLDQFMQSARFKKLKPKTQSGYTANYKRITEKKLEGGRTFGDAPYSQITPGVMRGYLDARVEDDAPVAGNRELAFMSSAFSWAYERDMVKANPCKGVRRETETARDRYITDADYKWAYETASPLLQIAMDLAYLLRAREIELCNMRFDEHVTKSHVTLYRAKGSKSQHILLTDKLREVLERARKESGSEWVLPNARGGRMSEEGLRTAWQRHMQAIVTEENAHHRFPFHDLKAKGVSDARGDKHKASGHKSRAMTAVYDRKLDRVKATR